MPRAPDPCRSGFRPVDSGRGDRVGHPGNGCFRTMRHQRCSPLPLSSRCLSAARMPHRRPQPGPHVDDRRAHADRWAAFFAGDTHDTAIGLHEADRSPDDVLSGPAVAECPHVAIDEDADFAAVRLAPVEPIFYRPRPAACSAAPRPPRSCKRCAASRALRRSTCQL